MPRLPILALVLSVLVAGACSSRAFKSAPYDLHPQVGVGEIHQGVRLLGTLRLADAEIDGLELCGLSGLAWDEDEGLLYAVSDRGVLFHLRPRFDSRGYLSGASPVAARPLQSASGQPVSRPFRDSEGLAIRNGDNRISGDTELVVSFEAKPRVVRYRPNGEWRGEVPLPATLREASNYRDSNRALEAVAIDPVWGIVTGPELALRNDPKSLVRLFSASGRSGFYPLGDAPGSALVAMETLPQGGLLTLERAFVSILHPFTIRLRRTELPRQDKRRLKVRDVAVFDSGQGWLVDNFEGLTRYRERRFFMVSDDNCNGLQATLLMYFELLPFEAPPATATEH